MNERALRREAWSLTATGLRLPESVEVRPTDPNSPRAFAATFRWDGELIELFVDCAEREYWWQTERTVLGFFIRSQDLWQYTHSTDLEPKAWIVDLHAHVWAHLDSSRELFGSTWDISDDHLEQPPPIGVTTSTLIGLRLEAKM